MLPGQNQSKRPHPHSPQEAEFRKSKLLLHSHVFKQRVYRQTVPYAVKIEFIAEVVNVAANNMKNSFSKQ